MTIQQAIQHCKEVATHCDIIDCANEYRQLADWLKELENYKQNKFIELNAYTHEPWNLNTKLISIRKNQIMNFYDTYSIYKHNTPCTMLTTLDGKSYEIKENYNEIKSILNE